MEHKVFEHKLAGGAKGLVVHVPSTRVVDLVFSFNSGFQFGDPKVYELPHVLEHLLPSGSTKNYPRHTGLSIEIQKGGAYGNAHTRRIHSTYDFQFAQLEQQRIIGLVHEYFLEQLFTDADVKTEIGNVRQELKRRLTQYSVVCSEAFMHAAYPRTYMTGGISLEQLDSIGRQKVVDYFHATHTRANGRIFISGNFPDGGKQVMGAIDRALANMPAGVYLEPDYSPFKSFAPCVINRDIDQIYYQGVWITKTLPDELQPAAWILNTVLTGSWASRIFGEARHRGLAYAVQAIANWTPGSSVFKLAGYVTPDNVEKLFGLVADQMTDIKMGGLTDKEVEEAKTLRIGARIRGYQTSGQLLGWYKSDYEERGVIEDWDGWNNKLRAVTKEQVIAVAKHVTTGANFGSAFVGPVTRADAQRFAKLLEPISK